MTSPAVTPHNELPGWYNVGEWSFDEKDEQDSNPVFARQAAEAWTAWAEFLERRQDAEKQEPLF
ncbi:hypothetical protein SEA_ZOOMAN_122 [Microbacterium phage Zooman]|nr:hypothetical protein SEA_ZOOMAN_122 [Microbacterium phage Zooman]